MADSAGPPEERWARRPRSGGLQKVVAWLVIIGLAALALVLLSERNARSFTLERVDGALVVRKGLFFPVGTRAWAPADPKLAPAYAPLQPPAGWATPEAQRFAGREELDQALYDLVARWAKDDVATEQRERLARAAGLVARAELLPGLSAAQRRDLEALRAEIGFYEGRDLVGRAADDLRQARERLERTARSPSSHAGEAGEAVRELEQALGGLHRAARAMGAKAGAGAQAATAGGTETGTETGTATGTETGTGTGTGTGTVTPTATATPAATPTATATATPAAPASPAR